MGLKLKKSSYYHPKNAVKNSYFESYLDTTDEWIVQRTGIESRYWEEVEASEMAIDAVRRLNLTQDDIDKIKIVIVATLSSDTIMPSIATTIQREFGLKEDIFATDINMACTGFVGATIIAHQMINENERALVIGVEKLSNVVNKNDRGSVMLFGDGAGASLYEKNNKEFYHVCGAVGSDDLKLLKSDEDKVYMHGQNIYKFAIDIAPKSLNKLLDTAGITIDDLDHVVLHQANLRIINSVAKKVGGAEKYYKNIQEYGNTSAASVGICLGEMNEKGLLLENQSVLLFGFGGGLTFAGTIIEV